VHYDGLALSSGMSWYVPFMAADVESFRLRYEGAALAENSIDINDLAPALLALSDLIQEANKIANQDRATISLKVKAIAPGSFQVDILALQSVWDQAADLLTGKTVTAITQILTLLGIPGALGVVGIYKFLKGKKPKEIKEISETTIQITNAEDRSINIEKIEYNFYISPQIRKSLYQVLKPAEKEGVDVVEFLNEKNESSKITKSDLPYYNPFSVQEELQETIRDVYVQVEHLWLSGDESRKWKFKEGDDGASWTALILDQDFLKKLIKGDVAITATDTLKVRVKQIQCKTNDSIKSEYQILNVLEHIKGAQQMPLEYGTQ
jgi:hypothetical protein